MLFPWHNESTGLRGHCIVQEAVRLLLLVLCAVCIAMALCCLLCWIILALSHSTATNPTSPLRPLFFGLISRKRASILTPQLYARTRRALMHLRGSWTAELPLRPIEGPQHRRKGKTFTVDDRLEHVIFLLLFKRQDSFWF